MRSRPESERCGYPQGVPPPPAAPHPSRAGSHVASGPEQQWYKGKMARLIFLNAAERCDQLTLRHSGAAVADVREEAHYRRGPDPSSGLQGSGWSRS